MNKFIINIHRSEKLALIVRDLLRSTGMFRDLSHINYAIEQRDFIHNRGLDMAVEVTPSYNGHSQFNFYKGCPDYINHTFIDAATEMGKLIELLETPQIKIGNYTAEFKNGGVQVGCVFATKQEVKDVLDALNTGRPSGNIIITDIKSDKMREIIRGLIHSVFTEAKFYEIHIRKGNYYGHNNEDGIGWYKRNGYEGIYVNAETEFGKLLELLEDKNLTVNGRPVKINGDTAEIAGVKISKETVKEVYNAIK